MALETVTTEVKTNSDGSIQVIKTSKSKTAKIKRKRQRMILEHLINIDRDDTAFEYLETFRGERHTINFIKRLRQASFTREDKLVARKRNHILNKFLERFDATTNKRPDATSLGDWLGIEIECVVPFDSVGVYAEYEVDHEGGDACEGGTCECPVPTAEYCSKKALDRLADEFKHKRIKNIQVKRDGSINAPEDHFGAEVTVLFKRNDKSNLKAVCDELNRLGAKVNKSCGLHVHLDCRDVKNTKRRVGMRASRLERCLPILKLMVPPSRLNNTYCKLSASGYTGDRYHAVNKTALERFGTIEVRLHSGTTDFTKIANWSELLYSISRGKFKRSSAPVETVFELQQATGIDTALYTYVLSRINTFNPGSRAGAPVQGTPDAEDFQCAEAA